jgi:hypothetical protein
MLQLEVRRSEPLEVEIGRTGERQKDSKREGKKDGNRKA